LNAHQGENIMDLSHRVPQSWLALYKCTAQLTRCRAIARRTARCRCRFR